MTQLICFRIAPHVFVAIVLASTEPWHLVRMAALICAQEMKTERKSVEDN